MRNPRSKEVKIFCDKETQMASVRIFKYRNYLWAGGRTLEFKRESSQLNGIFDFVKKHSPPNTLEADLWKQDNETAIIYVLDIKP